MEKLIVAPRNEQFSNNPLRRKAGRFMAKVGVATVCMIPPADLALSDPVGIKVYQAVNESVTMKNKTAERGVELGLNSGIIMAEVLSVGLLVARNKKLQNVFDEYDEYQEKKLESMSSKRKLASKVLNSPFAALQKLGEKVETLGVRVQNSRNKTVARTGKLAIDAGMVNALGTNGVILQETINGNPPSLGRITRIGALMTGSWLGVAEGVRTVYDNVPASRVPLNAVGQVFDTLTNVEVAHPWQTPVSTAVLGSIACGLAFTGFNIAEYHEQKNRETELPEDL